MTVNYCYASTLIILFFKNVSKVRVHVYKKIFFERRCENSYPLIQGLLEWPFSQLFFSNVSIWNQSKCNPFNIFSCRILIIFYKMSNITGFSNETTNELTIYAILCLNATKFYRQELASLFQMQEKLKATRNLVWSF